VGLEADFRTCLVWHVRKRRAAEEAKLRTKEVRNEPGEREPHTPILKQKTGPPRGSG